MKSILLLIALLIITFTNVKAEIKNFEQGSELSKIDLEKGINLGRYSTENDQNKVGLLYAMNLSPFAAADITSYEISYSFKLGSLLGNRTWIDLGYQSTSALYSQLGKPSSSVHSGYLQDDINAQTVTLKSYYIGASIQSNLVQNLISYDRLYESISAAVTYNSYSEEYAEGTFSGYGLKSTLGLYIRSSQHMHYGIKMGYNLTPVTKAPEEGETSSSNTLMLSFATVGFDLSFYF